MHTIIKTHKKRRKLLGNKNVIDSNWCALRGKCQQKHSSDRLREIRGKQNVWFSVLWIKRSEAIGTIGIIFKKKVSEENQHKAGQPLQTINTCPYSGSVRNNNKTLRSICLSFSVFLSPSRSLLILRKLFYSWYSLMNTHTAKYFWNASDEVMENLTETQILNFKWPGSCVFVYLCVLCTVNKNKHKSISFLFGSPALNVKWKTFSINAMMKYI